MVLKRSTLAGLTLVLVFALLSVQLAVMQDTDVGTADNPIEVYFVPSVEAGVIATGGEIMTAALEEATGLEFAEVRVPTSYAAAVEAMCASPENSIGFIPAAGYVVANNRCGVEVQAAAVRRGWPVYWAAYIVRRDSDIYVLGDLEGRTWGFPDTLSTSGYQFPAAELSAAGITPGEQVQTGSHNNTVLAVYNGEVDFGTTFFSPPLMPGSAWRIGDLPEPFDLTVDETNVTEDGLFVGDIRILDARANVAETAPDVVEQVRILGLTSPIPNDTLSFGAEFPEELREQIMAALIEFSETEAWAQSIGSEDFYGWTSIEPIEDEAYDVVRLQQEVLGITPEDIFAPRD